MGEAKRRQAVQRTPPLETEGIVVRLTERQQQRLAVYVREAEAAKQRVSDALTDILIGRDVDLDQLEQWGLRPDGQGGHVAVLVPKQPAAGRAAVED